MRCSSQRLMSEIYPAPMTIREHPNRVSGGRGCDRNPWMRSVNNNWNDSVDVVRPAFERCSDKAMSISEQKIRKPERSKSRQSLSPGSVSAGACCCCFMRHIANTAVPTSE